MYGAYLFILFIKVTGGRTTKLKPLIQILKSIENRTKEITDERICYNNNITESHHKFTPLEYLTFKWWLCPKEVLEQNTTLVARTN